MMRATARRVLAKAWAGPFDAGPLAHPVTVGDALLKLFQLLWRFGIAAILLIAAIAIAVWVASSLEPPPLSDQIVGTARVDERRCGKESPLLVSFANNSKRTVQDIGFEFVAKEDQRSSNLVTAPNYPKSDAIIAPGKVSELCWSLPELKPASPGAEIRYSIDVSYASDTPAT